jgi:hypothetical protein
MILRPKTLLLPSIVLLIGTLSGASATNAFADDPFKNIPTVLPTTPPPYTDLQGASAQQTGGKIKLSVTAGGDIPRFPDDYINSIPVFGYAWLDGANGVVAAIHPSFDDSTQNPRAWHTHTVTLDSNNCITDLGKAQGGISIKGDTLTLQISTKFVGNINPNGAASFEVHPDNNCPDPYLRVDVLDQEPIS